MIEFNLENTDGAPARRRGSKPAAPAQATDTIDGCPVLDRGDRLTARGWG